MKKQQILKFQSGSFKNWFKPRWTPLTLEEIALQAEENEKARRAELDRKLAEHKTAMNKEGKDYLTTSNDVTAVSSSKPQNEHLKERSSRGAKSHAEWEKEHPNATAWGNALSAVPLIVASLPAAATVGAGLNTLGDAAASTTAGQALTGTLTGTLGTKIAGVPLSTWGLTGLDAAVVAHGANSARQGEFTPMTALELLPAGNIVKPAIKMGTNITKPAITFLRDNYKLTMKNAPWYRPGLLNMSVVPLPSRVPSITRKLMPGNILEVLPEFDYRRASLLEQAEYILNNRNAFTTHPFLVRAVEGNPELKKFVKDIADGKVGIPNYTYHSGRQVPLLESTTGENPSLGALITAKETNIDKPHLITLTGIRPIEGTGGEIGKGGLEDFLTRNGYNFSTDSRANATEYSWLGDLSENTQRLNDYGFGTGKLNDYYLRLYKIVEDLNKKYGVKNYAYPNTVNTGRAPIYRGTNKPVNFSLHTHLSKNPNGATIKWDPVDRAVYEEAMDALSLFWGSEVYGGGVKETLIPRPGLKVLSDLPMDYRALSKHPIVGTDAKTLRLDYLPENIKTMDKFEKWASDNRIKSFQIGIIDDPLPSVSYGTRNFYIARKNGGSINNKRATH